MIGRLTGVLVADDAEGNVIVDVAGVGYELMVPLGTVGRAQAAIGSLVTLHVHTHMREDALLLYGFATAEDRVAFRKLLSVSSIGPRLALAVLSHLTANELARAVQQKDVTAFAGIPGVGKKTAERILLELRDKLQVVAGAAPMASKAPAKNGAVGAQLIEALTRMGFKAGEAERAVETLGERLATDPMEQLFRDALVLLRR